VIGTVERASVTLRGLTHAFPSDLDVLLTSPSGANVMLMSDVDGGPPGVVSVAYTFDDAAASPLPVASNAPSGVYRPTNDNSGGPDALPAPAPAGPYGTALAGVTGRTPNGNWSLYVFDDAGGDVGSIGSGWLLTLTTDLPADGGCNFTAMTIPAGAPGSTAGPSSAFPAGIVHVGVPVDLDQYKVRVDLLGLTHSYPRDLDVLLVGPQGQKVLVMSDAGGSGPGVNNVTLSFQDDAAAPLAQFVNPTTGFYRPSEYEPGDGFNGPAPPGPYATSLAAFKGTNPLGSWALYVQDDATGDVGSLSGWCLNFIPSIDAGDVPDMVFFGSSSIAWSPSPNATSYNIYRGETGQLPALLNGAIDSCRRFETLNQTFTGLTDIPPLGSFYWYIVRGANAQGEGASGVSHIQGQALARVVDSSGSCP
jgi:subtilisin-like proprotein convertase family protein